MNGEFPDLSKKEMFAPYLDLPSRVPEARWELAMNIKADDPETQRLTKLGWHLIDPHAVARTPPRYRRYLASATAEFTAIKGVDVSWRTGWVSDRAAAFLALGRPVITEDTGAGNICRQKAVFVLCATPEKRRTRRGGSCTTGPGFRGKPAQCAVEVFDSARNLRKILGL